jgi:hypothetical protein
MPASALRAPDHVVGAGGTAFGVAVAEKPSSTVPARACVAQATAHVANTNSPSARRGAATITVS